MPNPWSRIETYNYQMPVLPTVPFLPAVTQETAFFRIQGGTNTQVWCSSYNTVFLCSQPKGNVFGNLLHLVISSRQISPVGQLASLRLLLSVLRPCHLSLSLELVSCVTEASNCLCHHHRWHLYCLERLDQGIIMPKC